MGQGQAVPRSGIQFRTIAVLLCTLPFASLSTPVISSSQTYSNLAAEALSQRAAQISSVLAQAGFIPAEFTSNATVKLEGQSVHPSGSVSFSVCQYEFREGLVYSIRRKDLFEDKGPASLILTHLTNETLTLTTEAATNRAFAVLRALSYDPDRIRKTFSIRVSEDLLTAYPIRNGGPDFPKDLHFFGELISRQKIKITVEMLPQIPLEERQRVSTAEMRVQFLATSGELLEAWWLPDQRVSKALGMSCPPAITLNDTADFSAPLFFAVRQTNFGKARTITAEGAVDLLKAAWSELQNTIGTNRPKAVLVCDNLNQPHAVADSLKILSSGVPFAGVSHRFNMDLPFDPALMARLAQNKQGISLLAVAGNVDVQLEIVPNLDAESPEFGMENQDEMQRRFQQIREQFSPRIEPMLAGLNFPNDLPDHLLFLMEPCANSASSFIDSELQTRVRGKARVVSVMGASDSWSIGQGVTYFNGSVFSNAIALVRLSGNLPLQADHMHTMALAMARLSNAPPGYDLARLSARGPTRIVSGEVINPIRELAVGFGPHPMQEVLHFFGEKWVQFLLEADKMEVFRVAPRVYDEPDTGDPKTPEGYHLLSIGKTLDAESARVLAKALLGPQKGFMSLKNCAFNPGVIFQIWRGKEYARLVVCFQCNESTLAFYNADGKVVRRTFGFSFTGRSTLLEMARKALPDDRTLDKL